MQIKTLEFVEKLFRRYSCVGKVNNYFGLLAYYALCQAAVEGKNKELLDECIADISLYPDKIEHPYYHFELYRVGGIPRAWLYYKGLIGNDELMRKYADKTLNARADKAGILCMPSVKEKDLIWIDTVSCITPFMLYVGLRLNEERYINFAAEQCLKMYETFMDASCGLLHQGKGFMKNPEDISQDHWSRGNGWGYLGLAELVRYLPKNSKYRNTAEKYFRDLSSSLINYQTERGLWRQEITYNIAWEESSGTGLILYGLGTGIREGILTEPAYISAFKKGISGLVENCVDHDFSTKSSCPSCLCPGTGETVGTIYAYINERSPETNEPHSFGCIMLALIEAYRNGIEFIEK